MFKDTDPQCPPQRTADSVQHELLERLDYHYSPAIRAVSFTLPRGVSFKDAIAAVDDACVRQYSEHAVFEEVLRWLDGRDFATKSASGARDCEVIGVSKHTGDTRDVEFLRAIPEELILAASLYFLATRSDLLQDFRSRTNEQDIYVERSQVRGLEVRIRPADGVPAVNSESLIH